MFRNFYEKSYWNKIEHGIYEAKNQTSNIVIDLNKPECNLNNGDALIQIKKVLESKHFDWVQKIILLGKEDYIRYFKRKQKK